jgi:hypothetical protein
MTYLSKSASANRDLRFDASGRAIARPTPKGQGADVAGRAARRLNYETKPIRPVDPA